MWEGRNSGGKRGKLLPVPGPSLELSGKKGQVEGTLSPLPQPTARLVLPLFCCVTSFHPQLRP